MVLRGKRQKKLEGITVGFDGMPTHPLDVREL